VEALRETRKGVKGIREEREGEYPLGENSDGKKLPRSEAYCKKGGTAEFAGKRKGTTQNWQYEAESSRGSVSHEKGGKAHWRGPKGY